MEVPPCEHAGTDEGNPDASSDSDVSSFSEKRIHKRKAKWLGQHHCILSDKTAGTPKSPRWSHCKASKAAYLCCNGSGQEFASPLSGIASRQTTRMGFEVRTGWHLLKHIIIILWFIFLIRCVTLQGLLNHADHFSNCVVCSALEVCPLT